MGQALRVKAQADNSATLRRVRAAIERGYLKNLDDRKGRPYRLVLGDPLPKDIELLPETEALWGCTVAGESGEVCTPPPPAALGGRERFVL